MIPADPRPRRRRAPGLGRYPPRRGDGSRARSRRADRQRHERAPPRPGGPPSSPDTGKRGSCSPTCRATPETMQRRAPLRRRKPRRIRRISPSAHVRRLRRRPGSPRAADHRRSRHRLRQDRPPQSRNPARSIALFHGLGCPLLVGASRKSFIGRLSAGEAPKDSRLPGSLAPRGCTRSARAPTSCGCTTWRRPDRRSRCGGAFDDSRSAAVEVTRESTHGEPAPARPTARSSAPTAFAASRTGSR